MKLFGFLALMIAVFGFASCSPNRSSEQVCDIGSVLEATMQCWSKNNGTRFLLGDDAADIQDEFDAIDWNDLYQSVSNGGNITTYLNKAFEPAGGISGVGLGVILTVSDAIESIYPDNPELVKICDSLKAMLSCLKAYAAPCFGLVDAQIKGIPEKFKIQMNIPEHVDTEVFMQAINKDLCILCENNAVGLKTLLTTAMRARDSKGIKDEKVRLNIYKDC